MRNLRRGTNNDGDQSFLRRKSDDLSSGGGSDIRVADLFCGCGGLSLGVREAAKTLGKRFTAVFATDIDSACVDVYRDNFSPAQWQVGDIRRLINGKGGSQLTPEEGRLLDKIKRLDVLVAGPPCQGHSDLNNHTRRTDERNTLYERVGRFAEIVKPRFVLIENVPNVVHSRDRIVDSTITHLIKCGYTVDSGVVDLAELGVPQTRKRHVLVAGLGKQIVVKDVLKKHKLDVRRTVAWAIRDLENRQNGVTLDKPSKHSLRNKQRIAYLFENGLYDLPNNLRPECHQDGTHTYRAMYGRLCYGKPAQTITSGFVSPGQGRFIHPTRRRTLTPHEAARIQFFPDFFSFSKASSRTALAGMIGNAVPMKLSYVFCLEFFLI